MMSFKGFVHFILVFKFVGAEFFLVFIYSPLISLESGVLPLLFLIVLLSVWFYLLCFVVFVVSEKGK